jgi:hypothetical protein
MIVHTHQLTSLHHMHEKWCQFIYERAYKDKGTVLTLGSLKHHLIFKEFLATGAAVMRIYEPSAEACNSWATLVRPGVESNFHDHPSHKWVLVYYPQAQEDMGDLLVGQGEDQVRVTPREGLCVMYDSETLHKIELNTTDKIRYSMVILANTK